MNVHITKTYNLGKLAGLQQKNALNAGSLLGFKEISFFKFPDQYDSDEELDIRMDGIISSLCNEDVVVFQYPSFVSSRYDQTFIRHVRQYYGTKIIMFVHALGCSENADGYANLQDEISLLNQADLLIVPSKQFHQYLIDNGLREMKVLYQELPDCVTDINMRRHDARKIYILSEELEPGTEATETNVLMLPFDEYHLSETLFRISDGGMGLVWNFDEERKDIFTNMQALGMFLAAGIPVIMQEGLPCDELVSRFGIGKIAKNMGEVYQICSNLNDGEFEQLYTNVHILQGLITTGAFTRKLLLDAIIDVRLP